MDKGFDYYINIQYDVIVKKRGDRYIVIIPELSLIEEDITLDTAYNRLEKRKEQYFRDMIEWGYQDYIAKPGKDKREIKESQDLAPFITKFAIVLVTCLALFAFAGKAALNTAPGLIKTKFRTLLNEPDRFLIKFNEMMDNRTDEQRKSLKEQVRRTAINVKPYTDEIKGLLTDADNGECSSGPIK